MPRPISGTLERRAHGWAARVTMPDRSRPYLELPADLTEQEARELAKNLAEEAIAGRLRPRAEATATRASGETVEQFAERWLAERTRRGLHSVDVDRGRLRTWVLPSLGALPMAAVTERDLRALVAKLDASVQVEACNWKTALNAWGLVTKMFDDATHAKSDALRVLSSNPAVGVKGPDRGFQKAKAFLYPTELDQLLRSSEVPLRWRRLFAVATYLFARAGELEALEWSGVDLERGTVHFHQTQDAETGELHELKNKVARRFAFEPALLPLLKALRAETGGAGRVFPWFPPRELGASTLRDSLRRAGVTREELFANTKRQKHLTFHDLRATGTTWMAVRGDEPLKIQLRAGHETFSTTQLYIRTAEVLDRASFGEVFSPLPECLLGAPVPPRASQESSGESSVAPGDAEQTQGKEPKKSRPQRDSNPR